MRENGVLKVVVVGAGSIAREYALRHLVKANGVEVVAVVDVDLEMAQELANDVAWQRAGAPVIGSRYRETADRDFVLSKLLPSVVASASLSQEILAIADMCYLATPPSTHNALAMIVLQANKHLLMEKPLSVSNEDADSIVEAADTAFRSCGVVTNVNIGMRHNSALHEMKRLIADGSLLGDVNHFSLRLHFRQWPRAWQCQPWVARRAQGGPLLEVGTHYLFALLQLIGGLAAIATVEGSCTYPNIDVDPEQELCETACTATIMLTNGSRVEIDVQSQSSDALDAGKDIYELVAHGEKGRFLSLSDFLDLKFGNDLLLSGEYGRVQCISELLLAATEGKGTKAKLVTPGDAREVQRLVHTLRHLSLRPTSSSPP